MELVGVAWTRDYWAGTTLFRNANDFNETMIMLEEYGYIKRKTVQGANGNNKSSIVLYVNPLIYNL